MSAKEKARILWIEDNADIELPHLAIPVFMHHGYQLTISDNATNAVFQLENQNYDVVIFDIRLRPGNDEEFIERYKALIRNNQPPRLGLYILRKLLGQNVDDDYSKSQDSLLDAKRIGIMSVDSWSDMQKKLESMGISEVVYTQKRAFMPRTALLDLVEKVLNYANEEGK